MEFRVIKNVARRSGTFCYSIVLNEAWLLPHFLDHYRKLGISYFVFYDDGSTDGTLELLLSQPDCAVLVTAGEAQGDPAHWLKQQITLSNFVPQHFGDGNWSITADADEFLLLPTRFADIDQLTAYLDLRELKCVQGPMVDFYPARLSDRDFGDKSPFEGAPWFDRDPTFIRLNPRLPPSLTRRGIRARLYEMLADRHPERFEALFGRDPRRAGLQLVKVPLLKTRSGIRRTSPHSVDLAPPMGIRIALAHFKFFPGSDSKAAEAIERNTHFRDALNYRFLQAAFELLSDEPLVTDRSIRYETPTSLESAGLIWAD